jgi:hypothetical protein
VKMVSPLVTRIAGIALLIAAALSIYIGAYDKLIQQYEPLHWDFNWLIVAVTAAAGSLLIAFPKNVRIVALSGVAWPIGYAASLSVDVFTRLCLGGSASNCWPSKTDAFQYLIMNNPNIAGGYGWQLWTGTMPTIIILMLIAFVLSILTLVGLKKRKASSPKKETTPTTPPTGQTISRLMARP